MGRYTAKDIVNMVREEDVAFIRLQFTDMFGTLKNVAITPAQLLRALSGKVMFNGSSIEGFARIEESDMFLVPDLDTFAIFPWRPQQGKVARMICNVRRTDGTPFEGDSRYILQKAIEDAAGDGYLLNVGTECEFFLFQTDDEGNPTTNTREMAGYFDLGPIDFGENARRDIVLTLEDMGFEIETSHHEGAPPGLRVGVHRDGHEIEVAVGGKERDGLAGSEPSREIEEDVIVAVGKEILKVTEDITCVVEPVLPRRKAEDVERLRLGGVVPQPPGEGRLRVIGDPHLRLPEFHEMVRRIIEVKDADALPVGVGEVGCEHGGDRRLADTTLLVVYAEPYHQMIV